VSIAARMTRKALANLLGDNPRLLRAFEAQADAIDTNAANLSTTAQATDDLNQATVLVLSSNTAFQNERVLELGVGLSGQDIDGKLKLRTSDTIPKINGGFKLFLTVAGDTVLLLPLTGTVATTGNIETLAKKTLNAPKISGIADYADDAAAAAGGVPVGGIYRTASALKIRVA
jgi:hypothetical protein